MALDMSTYEHFLERRAEGDIKSYAVQSLFLFVSVQFLYQLQKIIRRNFELRRK